MDEKVAPLRAQLSTLEAPYRKALADRKQAMLTADERAVMAIPDAKRTPEQKKIVKGLQTSIRITWEEVAAAVEANPADHEKREHLKREIADLQREIPRPPAHAMALVDQKSEAPDTHVYRRGEYREQGAEGGPETAGRDPRLAEEEDLRPGFHRPDGEDDRPTRRRWPTGSPVRRIR